MRKLLTVLGLGLAALPTGSEAAFRYFDPTDSAAVPRTFSSTGFYADMAGKIPVPEAVLFEINSALWSDGAWKQRWILLPPGKAIPYDDTTDFFAYPESTVFVKNFWLETREGDPGTRVLWETRLLMKKTGAGDDPPWHGFSYRWNRAQDEAHLVSPTEEFDTLFRYADAGGRRTYKRWRFPSATCKTCHKMGSGQDPSRRVEGRAVLGFHPAQLKRPSAAFQAAGRDQVLDFFARGVFTGTAPDSASLRRRFLGIHEELPPSLTPDGRRQALDVKARSYLAANCSGCHGDRGIAFGAIGEKQVNFDFHRLTPAIPFAHFPTQRFFLNDTQSFPPHQDPYGRAAYIEAVVLAGLDTSAGKPWNMALPPHTGDPRETVVPALIYPGYPSATELLYRQVRRASARVDSIRFFRYYSLTAASGDTGSIAKMNWLFQDPWGSPAWESTLAKHGFSLDSLFTAAGQLADGKYYWRRAPEQMPELGSFLPDTAALKVLAEWVRQYPPTVGIRAPRAKHGGLPRRLGPLLSVPEGWSGPAMVLDLRGRRWDLDPVRPGVYRLPGALRPGVHLFRIGRHAFRMAVF